MLKVLATLTVLVSVSFCAQVYPGTNKRPILSDEEAASFSKSAYFQGWKPPTISTSNATYTVGGDGGGNNYYKTIQAAVVAAIADGAKEQVPTRKYIKITEGTYNQIVYIPPTNVPITLYGAGKDPASTVISFALAASTTGADYKKLVGDLFTTNYPGYAFYSTCASRAAIGTDCSSVVWAKADNVQISNLSIVNLSKKEGKVNQAVALYANGDKIQVSNSRLIGRQNTLWSGVVGKIVTRGHVTNTFIEGDVDFVFGGGSTVFESCTFYARSGGSDVAIIFAPGTDATHKYGFLVSGSKITGDKSFFTTKNVYLARAWDSSSVPGTTTNGQLVVRESKIDGIISSKGPYATATLGRLFAGNIVKGRNLNDVHFNRFWEHGNTGNGA